MSDQLRPRLEARRTHERPHVLIVSDDPDLAGFLGDGLPLGGFWVSIIASGLQVLEVFRLRQFDILAVDNDLQGFDAVELLRRLRGKSELDSDRESRTSAPAVLFASATREPDGLVGLGVERVIRPPVELEDVVRQFHEVFADWRQDNPDTPLADSANLAF
jgi:CheY-like chemotaxis protein